MYQQESIEKRIKDKIQDYEDQLNKKEENHRAEIALLNEDSENTLNQLKKIFADEKKRLEDKLNTQKQKYDEKTNNIINEYEEKLKEQETQNKTELDNSISALIFLFLYDGSFEFFFLVFPYPSNPVKIFCPLSKNNSLL